MENNNQSSTFFDFCKKICKKKGFWGTIVALLALIWPKPGN